VQWGLLERPRRGEGMTTGAANSRLITELGTGLAFLTRLPVRGASGGAGSLARAAWTFPLVGALVGACGALAYWGAAAVGLPPVVAGVLAIAATLLVTGALHEDGLADTADGFGAGGTRERKLEIMRDSRIGTYGVAALGVSILLRAGAVASLIEPVLVAPALIAAHAAARTTLPAFMRFVPRARADGLAAGAGQPSMTSVIVAALVGAAALAVCFDLMGMLIALALLVAAASFMAWLTLRQIGGQTGDVLGALEQTGEILVLLAAASLL
jgi:adenosylcobinamide-GDP ribazoletransferase